MNLLKELQALSREWEWRDLGMGQVVTPGRDNHGNLAAYVAAVAYLPRTGETKVFMFTDDELEPFREMAKEIGYPSVEAALEDFLKSKSYLEDDKPCQPQQRHRTPHLPPPDRLLRR